jgi:hypothetical protein
MKREGEIDECGRGGKGDEERKSGSEGRERVRE